MKKYLSKNILNINLFIVIMSFFTLFFTIDMYSINNITPEFPLINIANLPFLRMEFIIIIFSITLTIGIIVGILSKSKLNILSNISIFILGFLILIIAIFDVYTLQTILPTLRISHIIMVLSQIVAIICGTTGLFIGILIIKLLKNFKRENLKVALLSLLFSVVLSTLSISNNMYKVIYIFLGVCLLVNFALNQYLPIKNSYCVENQKIDIYSNISCFLSFGILTFMSFTANSYILNTLNLSQYAYLVSLAFLFVFFIIGLYVNIPYLLKSIIIIFILLLSLLISFIQNDILLFISFIIIPLCLGMILEKKDFRVKFSILTACISIFIFSILSYVCVHYSSYIIKYSNNRIEYQMDSLNYILISICTIIMIITILSKFIFNKLKYTKNSDK